MTRATAADYRRTPLPATARTPLGWLAACWGLLVFSPFIGFQTVLIALIGGATSIGGPILAAIVFSLLAETLRLQLPYGYMMVLGLLLILCMMYLPNGLATLWQRRKPAAEAHHG